jgi:hypothetical protein
LFERHSPVRSEMINSVDLVQGPESMACPEPFQTSWLPPQGSESSGVVASTPRTEDDAKSSN